MSHALLLIGVLAAPVLNGLQRQWLQSLAVRQGLLLSLSLLIGFAYCGLWIGVLAVAGLAVCVLANALHRSAQQRVQSPLVWPAVALGIAGLAGARSEAFVAWWAHIQQHVLKYSPIAVLVGTSYFLLRALSLCFDARKGKLKSAPDVSTTLNYLLFFPTLISGPIDRYGRFSQDLVTPRTVDGAVMDAALWRGVAGLFKKVVLADTLMPYALPALIGDAANLSAMQAWIGFYAWALVIYLDFSGYCDIAISIGRVLGFNVPENFRWPYLARSITEFWRRWHITLSEWLRDYVFLPSGMAFSRTLRGHSLIAGCMAAMLTFALCGLWHGFETHFLVWGLMHGAWVFGHKLYQDLARTTLPKGVVGFLRNNPAGHALCVLLTFHGVAVSWVFFGAPDLAAAIAYLRAMTGGAA